MWVKTMDGKMRNLSHATFIETRETFQQSRDGGGGYTEVLNEGGQKTLRTINVVAYINGEVEVLASLSTDTGISIEVVQNKANLAMSSLTAGLQKNESLVSLEFLR